jgi:hypothetical protein
MDIISVPIKVRLIPDSVLPKAQLPDGCFPSALSGCIPYLSRSNQAQISFGEQPFDLLPADGKIRIILRYYPDTMQVVRQQADCIQCVREALAYRQTRPILPASNQALRSKLRAASVVRIGRRL